MTSKEELSRKRYRGILKGTVDNAEKLTANADLSSVAIYRDELENNWANYVNAFNLHEDTLVGRDEDAITAINGEYTTAHNTYLTTKLHLGKLMAANPAGGTLNSTMFDATNQDHTKTVKLPPIKITPFSGDLKDWTEFKATCRSILTEKISDVQRLQYLKEALSGEPRELVAHVLPADGAYDRAMNLLVTRFENTRAIVNMHLQKLYTIQRDESAAETVVILRKVINTLNGLKAALHCIDIDTDTWDAILIYNTSQCLHPLSLKAWEERLEGKRVIPPLQTYVDFLETRITILENTASFHTVATCSKGTPKPFNFQSHGNFKHGKQEKAKMFYTLKAEFKCLICKKNHLSNRCDGLNRMSIRERREAVAKSGVCFNCLQAHLVANCPFTSTCKKCDQNHHTMLHEDKPTVMLNQTGETSEEEPFEENADDRISEFAAEQFYHISINSVTILATALVPVQWNGRSIILRALIDQGSTANLITNRACQVLQLNQIRTNVPMTGVGNSPVGTVLAKTDFSIGSVYDTSYRHDIKSMVVPSITSTHAIDSYHPNKWPHIKPLPLADPQFFEANRIDLLLGASAYAEVVLGGIAKGGVDEPIAQHTKLGWIVFGIACVDDTFKAVCNAIHNQPPNNSDAELLTQLEKFWQLEHVESIKHFTPEEQAAEDAFTTSLRRDSNGHFVVDLPFKVDPSSDCLGESKLLAERRLKSTNRRFEKNPIVQQMYNDNLMEYLTLGHMEKLKPNETPRYYLPHHPVIKESSVTTKVRTVFDASAKTSNGKSLNDILYVGPTIQPDLFDQLLRWRRFRYSLSGDIEKMYRQVKINPDHALFQCVLIYNPTTKQIETYKLTTVTFGTASAPFQAIRAIDEIGKLIESTNPKLAEAIRNSFYVDDYLGTTDSLEEACQLQREITAELAEFGFNLRQWKANDPQILTNVKAAEKEAMIDFDATFKTLGLMWQPSSDTFQFKSCQPKSFEHWTKRTILSEIAKLFDPLGFLSPSVAQAKMLMQDIWRLPNSISWDAQIPVHIENRWRRIFEQLSTPIPITVPRWMGLRGDSVNVQLHAFCDASTLCFAGVVFVRIQSADGQISCNLLTSKTKLAPIKTISVPRLELCGAVLVTTLLKRCIDTLALQNAEIHAWCDSKIALAWITSCPSKWNTFVAHRVTTIQETLPNLKWHHVTTDQNPADIASRGASIMDLTSCSMWWNGPTFLMNPELVTSHDMQIEMDQCDMPERKKNVSVMLTIEPQQNHVLNNFALTTYTQLLRFTVLAMRWRNRTKRLYATITAREIMNAELKWVKIVQNEAFQRDIVDIRGDSKCHNQLLLPLNPFIDEHGALRMHGRIGNADMHSQTTAMILPAKHTFTNLIIKNAHENVLHGGVQMTLRKLREKFWIIHARRQVQKAIHDCLLCFRYRMRPLKQQMGSLPLFRTEQARPFAFVGCDYTGHFEVKLANRRNSPTSKAYIALFVCLATKAIHLEVAVDMSTAEFIMAFENFIARRGIPNVLYSDNGTNFIGAAKEINTMFSQMVSQNNAFTKLLAAKHIQFKNIPPRASHMAGIWERQVASVKYNLRRVLGDTKLTTRHFDYVLKQIEACLNSRPLWAVSPDGDDIDVLTPSHFFNFQAINTLPRPDLAHIPLNRLDQYQYLYRLYCDFWKDWSQEYLHQFQTRMKWHTKQPNLQIGNIVLIAEDNVPPSRWVAGRVINTYPDKNGLVRVADVRLANGTIFERPIHKLGLLPLPNNELVEQKAQRGENVVERTHHSNDES